MRKKLLLRFVLGSKLLFFSFFIINAQSNIIIVTNTTQTGCLGSFVEFSIIFEDANVVATMATDNNMSDGITGSVDCNMCTSGSIGVLTLKVDLTSGTIGSSQTFDVKLTDPTGFLNNSGVASLSQTINMITFRFTVNVDGQPAAAVSPSSPFICNGAPVNITATSTNGSSVSSYAWSADGGDGSFQGDVNPGNSVVAVVTDEDIYRVTVTNACGFDTDNVFVGTNLTPLVSLSCDDNGNNTTTLTVDILNDASDVTIQYFNDGMLQNTVTGLDGPTSSMQLINSQVYLNQEFTIIASNACGNASNSQFCEILLPVELQYFKASQDDESVMIEWSTLTEINNDYFSVEKSTNGVDFMEVTTIQGAGTSQQPHYYSYLDKQAMKTAAVGNTLYYRLKQTDFDGSITYSDLVVVTLPGTGLLTINRLWQETNDLVVDFSIPSRSTIEGRVFSMDGRLISIQKQSAEAGSNQLLFDTSQLAPGMYMFFATDGEQLASQKFIKL